MKRYEIIPCEGNNYNEGYFVVGSAKELKKVYFDMVLDYYNAISDYRPYQSIDLSNVNPLLHDYAILVIASGGEHYNTFRAVKASMFMRYLCNDWVKPA